MQQDGGRVPTTPVLRRPSAKGARPAPGALVAVGALSCTVMAALGVALSGPAAALEDTRRPVADVTHGPSCGPGVVRVELVNGTEPHRVALVFGDGVEQQVAEVGPGERAELGSADVDWGTTVAVRIAVTDLDGTAELPLDLGTYTRPSREDCDALVPLAAETAAPALDARAAGSPATGRPLPSSTGDGSPVLGTAAAEQAAAAAVAPGGVVTVRGSGFSPGEVVDVSLDGVDGPLATVVAAEDGSVEAVVQIPRAVELGPVTVQLVGRTSSATSGLDLQVAARQQPLVVTSDPLPVVAAGTALLVASAAVGGAAARRPRTAPARAPASWR